MYVVQSSSGEFCLQEKWTLVCVSIDLTPPTMY